MALFKTITLVFLVMALSAGVVNGQAITNAPKNFTGKVGETANFSCSVDFGGIQTTMSWEFADVPVYNYQFGTEDYPFGKKKYSVARDVTTFILTVSHLDHKDGGEYKCLVVDVWHTAVLLVLDTPDLFVSTTNPVAGNTADFMCTARFGGPRKETISPDQYPRLQMFLDGEPLHESTEEQIPAGSAYWYNLTQIKNMTLESSMNRKKAACVIETTSPSVQVTTTREVKVLYSPQGISFTPNRSEYDVGSVINCTADGNPEPHFLWSNTKNTRPATPGPSLLITEDLIGYNTWKCTASNTISGHSHKESIVAVFNIGPKEDSNVSPEKRNSNKDLDPWIIAVGITISILLVIAGLTTLYCHRLRKSKYRSVPTEQDMSMECPTNSMGVISEVIESMEDGVICKTRKATIDPRLDTDCRIPLDYVVLIIPSKAVTKRMTVSVTERDNSRKRKQEFKSSGIDDILKPVIQLSLQPLGLQLAVPAELLVKRGKMTEHDNLLVVNRLPQDDLWTDITNKCCLEVRAEGTVFKVSVLTEIEILLSNVNDDISNKAIAVLNNLCMPCNFFVYYKPPESVLRFFVEALSDNNQTHRHEEPRDCVHVSTGKSTQNIADNSYLKFYYDSFNFAGKHNLQMKLCKTQWDYFYLPVTAKGIRDLPDYISVYESDNGKLLATLTVAKSGYKTKNEGLTEIIAGLDDYMDLDDHTTQMIEGLLSELQDKLPFEGPSPLSHLIKKAEILIQSDYFVWVTRALAVKFANMLEERQEDPLQCLVELLEKDDLPPLTKHPGKLLEIIKELLKVDGPAVTRSRCFRILTRTAKWRICTSDRMQQLHWNGNLLDALKCLIEHGASPSWSPEGSSDGSNLHLLIVAVKYVSLHKSDLFGIFMDLFEVMMTEASLGCSNVDGEGMTILHTLVNGITPLLPEIAEQQIKVITLIKERNPSLFDAKNNLRHTPLHTFMTSVLLPAINDVSDSERDQFPETDKEWRDSEQSCLLVLKSLISATNIDLQCNKGQTPLHYFIKHAKNRSAHAKMFLEIEYNDENDKTAFDIMKLAAEEWEEQPNTFLEVVNCLRSDANVNLQNEDKQTPLHEFTLAANEWASEPAVFLKVVRCLTSESNIDFQTQSNHTPLFEFTLATHRWANYPQTDIFLEVVKCLKSPSNIDVQTETGVSPLHEVIKAAGKWAKYHKTFLEVVECLISYSNINFQTVEGDTADGLFTESAKNWSSQPFSDVTKCLICYSKSNVKEPYEKS